MARKSSEAASQGTLIRGADGSLYFVTDDKKWALRLPDKYTQEAREWLDKEGFIATPEELPAIHGTGLIDRITTEIVRVNLNRLATLGKRKPDAK